MASVFNVSSMTAEEIAERYGPVPLWRIRSAPAPGTATEDDVIAIIDHENRACELIDGFLLEKDVGTEADLIGSWIITLLNIFVLPRKLGAVLGSHGAVRLNEDRIRIPDVAFYPKESLPNGKVPREGIPSLIPALAVEVLSPGNTEKEMQEKLRDYFTAGVNIVWYVHPDRRAVEVFEAVDSMTTCEGETLLKVPSELAGLEITAAKVFEVLT
ncbi:Uma2 family endonuclease [Calycomorphotria hydatis]|uniref:Putative restriction endonuclease domain-containing protein n=1 Tax=Calycomorphotria hydatis TaxID=2528027 RepID=A0A517TDX4_9PLAN|nr:Uma2 family endonuclease [Calycomorphotria hydatis]QDT66566.1 hypothetical protein V22_38360 [Calycomorphotria hydatis]